MKPFIAVLFCVGVIASGYASQMVFVEDTEEGTLTVRDGKVDVLTYRFGDQLKQGIDPEQTRSCYIHPLYSLDGKPLTEDFPVDHPHHHGLCWTWPVVRTRGQDTQTWHPANLRQYFVRWHKREAENGRAALRVENAWKLDGGEVVAREIVTLHVHPIIEIGRTIDVEIKIESVGGPLTLQGAPDQNKGYGGFTLRGAPLFKDLPILTDQGELKGDADNKTLHWACLSTGKEGVAIFVSPDHPDFPPSWVLRSSYAGLLNVSWPGIKPVTLQPGKEVILRYRLYIPRGGVTADRISRAYAQYLSAHKQ